MIVDRPVIDSAQLWSLRQREFRVLGRMEDNHVGSHPSVRPPLPASVSRSSSYHSNNLSRQTQTSPRKPLDSRTGILVYNLPTQPTILSPKLSPDRRAFEPDGVQPKKITATAALGAAELWSLRQREHCLLARGEDNEVGSQLPPLPTTVSSPSDYHSNRPSCKTSQTYSRSSGRTCHPDVYPAQGLSTSQAATLEKRMKKMELEDIRLCIKQESQDDKECKLLENRFREEEWRQEEEHWRKDELLRDDLLTTKKERHQARAEKGPEKTRLRSSVLSDGGRQADRIPPTLQPTPSSQSALKPSPSAPLQMGQWNIPVSLASLAAHLPGCPALVPGSYFSRPPANPAEFHFQPTRGSKPALRPSLPVFSRGRESDFSRFKRSLDRVLKNDLCLSEQQKYQVLLGLLKLPSALQLAKAYIHDPTPYTSALQALQGKYTLPRQTVHHHFHHHDHHHHYPSSLSSTNITS